MKVSSVYIMEACENFSVTRENKSNSKSQVRAPNLCRTEPSPKKSVTSIFTSNLFSGHTDWHTKKIKVKNQKTAMSPLYFYINSLFNCFFSDPRHNKALTCS